MTNIVNYPRPCPLVTTISERAREEFYNLALGNWFKHADRG